LFTLRDVETLSGGWKTFVPLSESRDLDGKLSDTPPRKSMMRFISQGSARYLGNTGEVVNINQKSRLIRSRTYPPIGALLEECKVMKAEVFGKPVMKPGYIQGQYVCPFQVNYQGLSKVKKSNMWPHARNCVRQFLMDRFIKGLPDMSPVDAETAINGIAGTCFKSVNMSTAAGPSLKGKKREHFIEYTTEDGILVREPKEEVMTQIDEILSRYLRDEHVGAITKGQLKDEPRKSSKIREGKTRLFYVGQTAFLVVCRMFLGPFYSMIMEHSDLFKSSIGIDAHRDADELFCRFYRGEGKYMMDADVKGMDQNTPYEVCEDVMFVIEKVLAAKGYNADAIKITKGILSDILMPIVIINGDVFQVPALLPSGSYGTAELNGLRNFYIFLYCLCRATGNISKSFDRYVDLSTYGDDIIARIDEHLQGEFNPEIYARVCKTELDMDITSAAKDGVHRMVTIGEVSFLKRTFRYHMGLGKNVMTLDASSLHKMCEWNLPSKVITLEQQTVESWQAMLREYFFYDDRCGYEKLRSLCHELYDTLEGKEVITFKTLSFDEMIAYYSSDQNASTEEEKHPDCDPDL